MHLRTDAVFMTDAGEQKVILDARGSTYLTANGSGRIILDALMSEVTLSHLVFLLSSQFGLDDDTALRDCLVFLNELDQRGWLVGGPASAPQPPKDS